MRIAQIFQYTKPALTLFIPKDAPDYRFLPTFATMNPIAIRLLNQQLMAPQFRHPAEVVHYMGAMQAQEYRLMRWAVAMRTTSRTSSRSGKPIKNFYESLMFGRKFLNLTFILSA